MKKISKDDLPKTWEEYSHMCSIKDWEKQANAFLALMQLVRLRDCYNKSEKPENKHAIAYDRKSDALHVWDVSKERLNHVLTFNTRYLANLFLVNFRDLIEQAKELI